MSDDSYIIFIFEGERAEKQIYNCLRASLLPERENTKHITYCYCADIYQLYQKIVSDSDLDFFMLLKDKILREKSLKNKPLRDKLHDDELLKIPRNKVAQIFLFFDYDGHATNADDEKIDHLLDFFDEETDQGKLYISYPMVESLRHVNETVPFQDVCVYCNWNIDYKRIVGSEGGQPFQNLARLSLDKWKFLIDQHLSKLNYLLTDNFTPPNEGATQLEIFQKQLEKYIQTHKKVAVLSAFPLFLADYYGYSRLGSMIDEILTGFNEPEGET